MRRSCFPKNLSSPPPTHKVFDPCSQFALLFVQFLLHVLCPMPTLHSSKHICLFLVPLHMQGARNWNPSQSQPSYQLIGVYNFPLSTRWARCIVSRRYFCWEIGCSHGTSCRVLNSNRRNTWSNRGTTKMPCEGIEEEISRICLLGWVPSTIRKLWRKARCYISNFFEFGHRLCRKGIIQVVRHLSECDPMLNYTPKSWHWIWYFGKGGVRWAIQPWGWRIPSPRGAMTGAWILTNCSEAKVVLCAACLLPCKRREELNLEAETMVSIYCPITNGLVAVGWIWWNWGSAWSAADEYALSWSWVGFEAVFWCGIDDWYCLWHMDLSANTLILRDGRKQ